MNDTFFGVPKDEEHLSRMAARYIFSEEGIPKRLPLQCDYNLSPDYQSGGAGLCSTCEDYAKFLDALACGGISRNGHRILSEETIKLMKTNHLTDKRCEDFEKLRLGYGWEKADSPK